MKRLLSMHLPGWSLRDESGRGLGGWYSVLFATTSVKVEGNRVTIYDLPRIPAGSMK